MTTSTAIATLNIKLVSSAMRGGRSLMLNRYTYWEKCIILM